MVPHFTVIAANHGPLAVVRLAAHAVDRVAISREDEGERTELDIRDFEERAHRLEPRGTLPGTAKSVTYGSVPLQEWKDGASVRSDTAMSERVR